MNETIRVVRMNALDAAIRAGATTENALSLAKEFFAFLSDSEDDTPAEDAPKARRRTAAKPTGETENGAASESAPTDRPTLVADEGKAEAAPAETAATTPDAAKSDASAPSSTSGPTEPTQDEKDALLAAATKFSQDHGHDALLAALKAVGAERFSAIPFDKYQAFRDAMAKAAAGASALS